MVVVVGDISCILMVVVILVLRRRGVFVVKVVVGDISCILMVVVILVGGVDVLREEGGPWLDHLSLPLPPQVFFFSIHCCPVNVFLVFEVVVVVGGGIFGKLSGLWNVGVVKGCV